MNGAEVAALAGVAVAITNIIAIVVAVYKLGRAVERFENIGKQQAIEIHELKETMKVVSEIITKVALQNERLDSHSGRLGRMEETIEDLRRGEGYILPFKYPKA